MFSNKEAIKTLVLMDATASQEDKDRVVMVLEGNATQGKGRDYNAALDNAAVLSFAAAAKMLGYKSRRGVYAAVRNGKLRGFYAGPEGTRASGVLSQSVRELLQKGGIRKRG